MANPQKQNTSRTVHNLAMIQLRCSIEFLSNMANTVVDKSLERGKNNLYSITTATCQMTVLKNVQTTEQFYFTNTSVRQCSPDFNNKWNKLLSDVQVGFKRGRSHIITLLSSDKQWKRQNICYFALLMTQRLLTG